MASGETVSVSSKTMNYAVGWRNRCTGGRPLCAGDAGGVLGRSYGQNSFHVVAKQRSSSPTLTLFFDTLLRQDGGAMVSRVDNYGWSAPARWMWWGRVGCVL